MRTHQGRKHENNLDNENLYSYGNPLAGKDSRKEEIADNRRIQGQSRGAKSENLSQYYRSYKFLRKNEATEAGSG